MKRLLLILCCCLSVPANADNPRLLVLGDSLSAGYGIPAEQGWASLLQQRLRAQGYPYQVVNASVSGDTTAGGAARLPALLEQHRPELLIIELGANDGLRGMGLRHIRGNLERMIAAGLQADCRVLLIGIRLPPNYGKAYTEQFRHIFTELEGSLEVPLVPFLLQGVARDRSLMQADGYHPSAAAQARLLDNVWPYLQPLLEKGPAR